MRKFNVILLTVLMIIACGKPQEKVARGFVVTSPEVAEIIAALGAEEEILAVTTECNYPPSLQQKPRIGSFGKIDLEKLYNFNPEYVFTSGLEQQNIAAELQKAGFSIIKVYPNSIKSFLDAIALIGEKIDRTAEAARLISDLTGEFSKYDSLSSEIRKPKVYVEIYGQPLMSVCDSSFIGEVVELAGGDNIFPQLPRAYSRINQEKVLIADPDIMIVTYPGITKAQIQDRKGWSQISAVKNGQIHTTKDIDPDLILRASPRVALGLEKLHRIFKHAE